VCFGVWVQVEEEQWEWRYVCIRDRIDKTLNRD